jgi:hypothetical protein
MTQFNYRTSKYNVCNLPGFTLDEALRLWKTKFSTFSDFKIDVIKHNALLELSSFVEEIWDEITPIAVLEAFKQSNIEIRRTMFDCIGVAKLFKELKPELLDRQVVGKVRMRWNKKYEPYKYRFEDTYELYKIEGYKLFSGTNETRTPNAVFAVRCWCTTTQHEYWIYVPQRAAYKFISTSPPNWKPDAINAIAWTIRIDISQPKRIFRQGDIIVVQESAASRVVRPYHLSRQQYLELMYSET